MNVTEGARRMRHAGQWILASALTAFVLSLVLSSILEHFPGTADRLLMVLLLPLCVPFGVVGVVLWVAGWILEGFAKQDH